ncbi:Aminotransferase [Theobroma cacao]|nr:Aminotransferase [Theobroma cacao]
MGKSSWDLWIEEALAKLESRKMFMPLRPMHLPTLKQQQQEAQTDEYETFHGIQPWYRLSIQISLPDSFFQRLLDGTELNCKNGRDDGKLSPNQQQQWKKLILFAGNDFLGLCRHPSIAKATAKKFQVETDKGGAFGRMLQACLLCRTGFSANLAVMVAIGSLAPLMRAGRGPTKEEKIAIFSDSLNHASIVDGIKLAERYGCVKFITNCNMKRKVVVTDSLFSMDGDFAPMIELVQLRRKHGFLLVVDDAHGTFFWGQNGGGVPEEFNCENDIDICIGTLSKAAASLGGFIACSQIWKQFIQSRGRSFMFSTAPPVPLTAASYASIVVARNEQWRRREIRKRM